LPVPHDAAIGGAPVRRMTGGHHERHRTRTMGWLRAAVLGANDGIVSTASLVIGVAAADVGRSYVLLSGIAGLVAGAMSMAAGEYVSVSSQADTEKADIERERRELQTDVDYETQELAAIYRGRGLEPALARQVAEQLMAVDPLGAHTRDELGINEVTTPHPVQAAVASAVSFACGALLPLLAVAAAPRLHLIPCVLLASLAVLAGLGALAARTGGASMLTGMARVTFWGACAMALTAGVGSLLGAVT
jgi:VIT1/CCC1 family predicted Fe2+/Mn2+ transporter